MAGKYFNVKNGVTAGTITLDANTGNISGSNFSVTGKSQLNNIANVKIQGGSTGQYIKTDGSGNLTFSDVITTPAPMPTLIDEANTVTIPDNYQGLFTVPITVNGTLEVDGVLVFVDGEVLEGSGNITIPNIISTGTITANVIKTTATTVNALPSAVTAGAGARAFVTDSTTRTFLESLTGGGNNKVPVVSDGIQWLIG